MDDYEPDYTQNFENNFGGKGSLTTKEVQEFRDYAKSKYPNNPWWRSGDPTQIAFYQIQEKWSLVSRKTFDDAVTKFLNPDWPKGCNYVINVWDIGSSLRAKVIEKFNAQNKG